MVAFLGRGTADGQYATNFNTLANDTSILAGNWAGTAGSLATASNGTYTFYGAAGSNYVVYLGEISNVFACVAPDSVNQIATAQLLVQVAWSETMPLSTVCPNRQGGICVSNGDAYAWSTNGWLMLTDTNNPAYSIPSNSWISVVFRANYGDTGNSPTSVYYRVYINGTNLVPVDTSKRYARGSSFAASPNGTYLRSSATFASTNTAGISGFYLAGSGAIDDLASYSGVSTNPVPGYPTSSGIDIRAYQGADGVYVEYVAENVEQDGTIRLYVYDTNGDLVSTNSAAVKMGPTATVRFRAQGLQLGRKYSFTIRDEVGKWWTLAGVAVTPFAADMLTMAPEGMTLRFNSIRERKYDIQWTPRLDVAFVTVVSNVEANAASTYTDVFVPRDPQAPSGFYRIIMK